MRIKKWAKATLKAAWRRTAAVNLIVTRRCDLACSYCHALRKGPELSPAEWIGIAEKLSRRFSVFTVSGGEPLLYKGLPELINGLSQIGIAGLCTNARLIKEHHLAAMHGLDYLNFSIDHMGDCLTSKKTAFGKLPLLAEYAKRHSFELFGTAVITSRNIDAIPDVAREMTRHNIPLNLQLVQNPGVADAFDTPEKTTQLARLQTELLAMKRGGYLIDESDEYINGFTSYTRGDCAVTCHAGDVYLAVDTDGRLMPCQDTAAVGASLLQTTDIDAALRDLPKSIPENCRCWWNCYHRYQDWKENPLSFLVQSGLKKPLRIIKQIKQFGN
jgi:MoaA/NifB/PqqE/SkfB family radical SAM enzyme